MLYFLGWVYFPVEVTRILLRVETVFKNKFTIIQTSQQMNRNSIRKIEAWPDQTTCYYLSTHHHNNNLFSKRFSSWRSFGNKRGYTLNIFRMQWSKEVKCIKGQFSVLTLSQYACSARSGLRKIWNEIKIVTWKHEWFIQTNKKTQSYLNPWKSVNIVRKSITRLRAVRQIAYRI